MKYKRILLKISGEALGGDKGFGIDKQVLDNISREIKDVYDSSIEVAAVIGGGNIFRGLKGASEGMDRASADYMGMLATVINALALQDNLERNFGIPTRVMSAIKMEQVAEPYIRRRAVRHLEKKRVVIFGGGTGNPFFSTDTAAALRAAEINADVMIKATRVGGVFSKDPLKEKDAVLIRKINYLDFIKMDLRVMDHTAVTLCRENNIDIIVLNINEKGALKRTLMGEQMGSLITDK